MKTLGLIILLFLSVPTMGQFTSDSTLMVRSVPHDTLAVGSKSDINRALANIVFWVLIDEWEVYAEECYNDSAKVVYEIDCMNDEPHQYFTGEWRHREPTMKGFILWLKKRLKEKP